MFFFKFDLMHDACEYNSSGHSFILYAICFYYDVVIITPWLLLYHSCYFSVAIIHMAIYSRGYYYIEAIITRGYYSCSHYAVVIITLAIMAGKAFLPIHSLKEHNGS